MRSVGFCLGASSVSMVVLEKTKEGIEIVKSITRHHDGNARGVFKEMYEEDDIKSIDDVCITGRKFRTFIDLSSISEPEAIELSINYLKEKYHHPDVLVSAGGETFMVYELDKKGKVINVFTGNKCASGTGEFFLQQIKRMDLNVDEALKLAKGTPPHTVAGRCSVFCKSDCTHALNKGEKKGKVVAGLCQMMSTKILELLKKTTNQNILLIGGATKNDVMIDFLRQERSNLLVADEAPYFEALGAALWAFDNDTKTIQSSLFKEGQSSFAFLPTIKDFEPKVTFKNLEQKQAQSGDICIIGLDVGSTTTKAVLLRKSDNAMLASVYLRTNGDPINASKACYKSLKEQISVDIKVIGVGVTGSGRQIAGLHALTEGVVNEIIAHATAAVHFDPEVDTIFEIGGQDAKYTYITNKVPSDYAMNEACSAGTGSFLEESAKESIGLETEEIADIALKSTNPPNFNDQCAAFISSDIKNAIQEGISQEDIVGGLVYSICQNYSNRVKGNRPVGKKIFMQGGVCYNKAVPIAMAAFTGNEIIVPPQPGLMGAYGVALEIKNKIELGLLSEQTFELEELSNRDATYANSFECAGGKEKCDRKCNINMIEIKGKKYPFGGACNKYVNMLKNVEYDALSLDLVNLREKLVFEKYAPKQNNNNNGKKIGILKSLMVNSLYPLYYNFFTNLGLNVILADNVDLEGIERKSAAFCYPIEMCHGYMGDMLKKDFDYMFLPQVRGMYVESTTDRSVVCPFVQAEPYYLKTTFKELKNKKVLTPVLDFNQGIHKMSKAFIRIGIELGFSTKQALKAYRHAFRHQLDMMKEMKEIGKRAIAQLNSEKDKIGIVLFGRPYNAMVNSANMGIPHKFSSRGYTIIPVDFLPYEEETVDYANMYWSMGQIILKGSKYVKKHDNLYGTFITNFSCGPDSFLLGYFREIMGQKPSLTLELDSHTADAGVDTRIEAFLDVIKSYIEVNLGTETTKETSNKFKMAEILIENGNLQIIDSTGKKLNPQDPRVKFLIPSMGDVSSRGIAATFRSLGIKTTNLNPPTEKELKIGRANSSCKECLPLSLTVGGLLDYIETKKTRDEVLIYFMPDAKGPCRFGQYNILMHNLIKKNKIENVTTLSLSATNSYAGLGMDFQLKAWRTVIIGDVMSDIYSALLVLAKDKEEGLKIYNQALDNIMLSIEKDDWKGLQSKLEEAASALSTIELTDSLHNAKKVGIVGEIFVRRDDFSRQHIVEKLAQKGIVSKVAPVSEWIHYLDYLLVKNPTNLNASFVKKMLTQVSSLFKNTNEKTIKRILAKSNLCEMQMVDMDKVISGVSELVSPNLSGEAILTVGTAITEIIDEVSGVIAIGPFGCMPNRVSEAIINDSLNTEKQRMTANQAVVSKILEENPSLPFLALETDGNAFPQVIQARLEVFCLQVERLHNQIQNLSNVHK